MYQFSSVQSVSRVQLFVAPWTAACQASLSITNSWSLLKLKCIEPVLPSNHLILCHPLLPPSIFPSFRVFSNESVLCIRWPKYWSFSFSTSPSNEYSGLISFRMDWLDLIAVQGTLKNLLQHHSLKASVLQHLAFFGSEGKASAFNAGRSGFDPWVRKILRRRKWQPTPVPLPGKSHRRRSPAGYSPWGHKESDTTERFHFTLAFFIVQLSHPYMTIGKPSL